MKLRDFIERLCYPDKMIIQIYLYADDLSNPIAVVQPDWEGVNPYSERQITSIRVHEANGWTLELQIILETPIFGQTFNPD